MNDIKLIGVGSPNGDDRVGWCVIDAIERMKDTILSSHIATGSLCLIKLDRPGPALLHYLTPDNGLVILVDAMKGNAIPGSYRLVHTYELEAAEDVSSHGFGVSHALALGQVMGLPLDHIRLYGIEIRHTDHGVSLSPPVQAAVLPLARQIAKDLRQLLSIDLQDGTQVMG